MKPPLKIIVLLAFLSIGGAISQARIGETEKEFEERYGKPSRVTRSAPVKQYRKAGWDLDARFREGKCEAITFRKVDRDDRNISENEQQLLLKANGGDREWESLGRNGMTITYRTTDGELLAQYDLSEVCFTIYTREVLNREREAKKAAEATKLKGF